MRTSQFFLTAVLTIAAAACDTSTSPMPGSSGALLDQDDGTIKADGSGATELPAGFGNATFALDTKVNASGKVQGTFRMYRVRNGLTSDFVGELTCLSVDPLTHRAWVGGVVTENNSTDPNQQLAIHQPGQDVWFRVVDNEELGTPDRSTVLGFKGVILTSAQYCHDMPWTANDVNTFPVVDGDIVVKPKH